MGSHHFRSQLTRHWKASLGAALLAMVSLGACFEPGILSPSPASNGAGPPGQAGDPFNLPPQASDDLGATAVNAALDIPVLANDSDPDGDSISVTRFTPPSNGTVSIQNARTLRYTSGPVACERSMVDVFTYSIEDGRGGSATASVRITVQGLPCPSGEKTLIVAVGAMQRRIVSCDGGRNWLRNISVDDTPVCWGRGVDCDHHAGAGKDVAYHDAEFVTVFGHGLADLGQLGPAMRTRDGVTWNEYPRPGLRFGTIGPVWSMGRYLTFTSGLWSSSDSGATWQEQSSPYFSINPRRIERFTHQGQETLVLFQSNSSGNIAQRSLNGGTTWLTTNYQAAGCPGAHHGFAYGNGSAILLSANEGSASPLCRSTNGGSDWTRFTLPYAAGDAPSGSILFSQGEFLVMGRTHGYSSTDGGVNWTSFTLTYQPERSVQLKGITPVIELSNGDFVGVNQRYPEAVYQTQHFMLSTDRGRTWRNADSYVGSHPITSIAYGAVSQLPPECEQAP